MSLTIWTFITLNLPIQRRCAIYETNIITVCTFLIILLQGGLLIDYNWMHYMKNKHTAYYLKYKHMFESLTMSNRYVLGLLVPESTSNLPVSHVSWSHDENILKKMGRNLYPKKPRFDYQRLIKISIKESKNLIAQVVGQYCCASTSQISQRWDKRLRDGRRAGYSWLYQQRS